MDRHSHTSYIMSVKWYAVAVRWFSLIYSCETIKLHLGRNLLVQLLFMQLANKVWGQL